jgi:pimeloyl-ACP methyl ester carboxylesterase
MREQRLTANGLEFGLLTEGAEDGELALCLHGFPDSATTWRHLLPALGAAGFHAVAPYLRGYAPTSLAPDGDYTLTALGADANALHEQLGGGRPGVIVGHDWGAAAAYTAVSAQPERWRAAVALSVPLTGARALDLFSHEQMRRSWYSFLFQLPVAESAVAEGDLAIVERLWADWSPGYESPDDVRRAKECLGGAARLAAAIEYYRQTPSAFRSEAPPPIETPLLYLHGEDDGCIGVDVVRAARDAFPPDARIEILPGAGHFVHLEKPDAVAGLVLGFV